jgi:hypothetical protein
MDERLKKALDISNYMITLNNQKRMIKEKYFNDLLFYYDGCQFLVTKDLITFVGYLVEHGTDNDVVLLDDNDTPIIIEDLVKFYEDILETYFLASNDYYNKFNDLKSKRSTEKLVNYDND